MKKQQIIQKIILKWFESLAKDDVYISIGSWEKSSVVVDGVIHQKNIKRLIKNIAAEFPEKELLAEGKIIIPFESEGFIIDGNFIGEIAAEKNLQGNYKIYIERCNK